MKNTFKLFGLAVVIAAIALNAMLITGCSDDSGNSGNSGISDDPGSSDDPLGLPYDPATGKYPVINLLVNRWGDPGEWTGEQWSNGGIIKLSDFSDIEPKQGDILQFKLSGVSDKDLDNFQIDLCNHNDDWSDVTMIGSGDRINLPKTFNDFIFEIYIYGSPKPNAPIYLNLQKILWTKDEDGEYIFDSGETLGDIPNGTVMATIKNLSIKVVKDGETDEPGDEPAVEYTDVVYSQDGSKVTLYLDGVVVPITRPQRAMSAANLTAYDYLEVIFIANGNTVREQWELGQPAGVSGVARGIDYAWSAGSTASGPVALLAVGKKSDKTLLGIGNIREVDGAAGTRINTGTNSVTFYIEAIKTGLVAAGDSPANTSDSFDFVSSGSTNTGWTRADHSARVTIGNASYPVYFLPGENNSIQNAKYEFFGAAATFAQQIRLNTASANDVVLIQKRIPRYMDGGRDMQPKNYVDTKTTITLGTSYTSTAGSPFVSVIPLVFTTGGTGIFSFYIEIPVYILTDDEGTNAGKLSPVAWKIRTGLGSELYSLDDGTSAGGCVLMGVGITSLYGIEWESLEY